MALTREQKLERAKQSIEALQSDEGFRAWAATRKTFRSYSLNNQLLISLQAPEGTHTVAGYGRWQSLGFQVQKGPQTIYIWAPLRLSEKKRKALAAAGEETPRMRFRMAAVFADSDVAAIDGSDTRPVPPKVQPVAGRSQLAIAAIKRLSAHLEAHMETTVEWRDLSDVSEGGWYNADEGLIVVDDNGEPAEQLTTLVHEGCHAAGVGYLKYGRGAAEAIVETAAWLVLDSIGVDTSARSLPYVAQWLTRDPDDDTLVTHALEIHKLAAEFEAVVIPPTKEARNGTDDDGPQRRGARPGNRQDVPVAA